MKLLERLYDVNAGQILVGGHNINSMDHEFLHHHIGIVSQEPILYNYSIADNICFGIPKDKRPSMNDIMAAAKLANAHNFIMDFPDG